jgi:hypothetical protein
MVVIGPGRIAGDSNDYTPITMPVVASARILISQKTSS